MSIEDELARLSPPAPTEPIEVTDRRALIVQRINVAIAAMGIAIVLLYGGMLALYLQMQHVETVVAQLQATADQNKLEVERLQADTLTNRENGLRTRAVNCQILVSLGESLPPQCLEPAVVALYDPEAPPTAGVNSEGQKANRALLCGLYDSLAMPAPPDLCV